MTAIAKKENKQAIKRNRTGSLHQTSSKIKRSMMFHTIIIKTSGLTNLNIRHPRLMYNMEDDKRQERERPLFPLTF